ncbi:2-oxoglutarate/2-oxoacid ferredoxin oxidoreductase, gamma subunit [Candidatus Syntrophocurvum alkaliphilum]|uniref:2-oxoglutarate/2-oxoacid ferredoxin oxidoreductase, gamma subunit n=1 Tax=Candidatus Syntrophocurvum alkaliphilum TaxID=2293317 RepID=A0A6I6DG39_9FIRM|nr:2-oxoacid:acceptor oxidoreductase family protein [Candidatus Syntrophocurvum alkaliphilum]QGT99872.1 2-oxoglutarate/2-oxoacid ferredoxin oxidoreductase, gamma subunit [Candidatus Syntrophocurvum alkaliphilum]
MAKERQVLFAGFGGQGVLSMGQFLTHAAMGSGKHVSWVPSYGAEMRGGTANCLVTIAEDEISSPLTDSPAMAVIMNRPSLDKFEPKVKPNGTIVVNSSLVDRKPSRDDLNVLELPVNKLAEEMGNPKSANMILIGAYLQKTGVVNVEDALDYFEDIFKGKKESVIENNKEAFLAGVKYAKENW